MYFLPTITTTCTGPLKGKLTVPQSSILKTWFSILDSWKLRWSRLERSFKTFKAFSEFIETVREIIESSFETFTWEKQRTFLAINFSHVWILRKAYFSFLYSQGRPILISGLYYFSLNLLIRKFVRELFFL